MGSGENFKSDGTVGSAYDVIGNDSHGHELVPYPVHDDFDIGDFHDVPNDSHNDVKASLCRELDAIREL